MHASLIDYTLHLADSTLILSHRNSEWCGHGPILEQDIAITNISLDLLGQARNFYQYAASLMGNDTHEDELAYTRTESAYKNLLLAEQPNVDWGHTLLRQYFFSQFQALLYEQLQNHPDTTLAAIASKSLKETRYHLRWSSEWVIRLGDGTEESHQKMLTAMDALWSYTGELFIPVAYEAVSGIDFDALKQAWLKQIMVVLTEAGIPVPDQRYFHTGGKTGIHTEQLGFILTDMQYLQRTYPNCQW
jgi:ring-1,2-phenylacetyl-CoA epoxidase subunit PaaC